MCHSCGLIAKSKELKVSSKELHGEHFDRAVFSHSHAEMRAVLVDKHAWSYQNRRYGEWEYVLNASVS